MKKRNRTLFQKLTAYWTGEEAERSPLPIIRKRKKKRKKEERETPALLRAEQAFFRTETAKAEKYKTELSPAVLFRKGEGKRREGMRSFSGKTFSGKEKRKERKLILRGKDPLTEEERKPLPLFSPAEEGKKREKTGRKEEAKAPETAMEVQPVPQKAPVLDTAFLMGEIEKRLWEERRSSGGRLGL